MALVLLAGGTQAQHTEFLDLYPGCNDNQASKIYEPNAWPKDLDTPVFPDGGDLELLRYITEQMEDVYPDVIDSTVKGKVYRAKGIVYVHITVDRCGKAINPKVVKSVNDKYDQVALDICNNLPIFKPGIINNLRVKVGMVLPFHFMRSQLPPKNNWTEGSSDDGDSWGSPEPDPTPAPKAKKAKKAAKKVQKQNDDWGWGDDSW